MAIDSLVELVGLLVALSAASERLVDIIKGFISPLQKPVPPNTLTPAQEGRRKAIIQFMAVVAGIATTGLSWPIIGDMFPDSGRSTFLVIVGLGFLVSGGSGLWNSVLSYLLAIKDLKKKQLKEA
jgi:hypothetical protein